MKKQILKLWLAVVGLAIVAAACYDDEGNYDYSTLSAVTVKTKSDTIYVTQFRTLEVPVDIQYEQGMSDEDYDFYWRLWSNDVGGVWNQKTVGETKNLTYEVNEVPGSYSLVLTCHNRITGVDTYKEIYLVVQGIITEGWMVLQEKDGKTDFDLIMSPYFSRRVEQEEILHNVFESVNGVPLEGRGVKISSFFSIGRYQNVVVLTDKGGARLDVVTMQRTYDIATLLQNVEVWEPENYLFYHYYYGASRNGYDAVLSGGRIYFYSVIGSMGFTSYTEPIRKDGLTYRAAPFAPCFFGYCNGIIYDELGERFLRIPNDNSWTFQEMPDGASGTHFDLKRIRGTLRYMETGFNNWEYGLFEDRDTHEHILYVFNFTSTSDMDKAMYRADNCPEIQDARHFAVGELGPVFYYATERDIYQYDYLGTNTAKKVYSLAADGEKITHMKIFKPRVHLYFPSHPYNCKILVFSTYNETTKEGKVYMYYINVSNGAIDFSSEKVFEGFGEVLDMEFNFTKYGS